jgi:hypothetical protein
MARSTKSWWWEDSKGVDQGWRLNFPVYALSHGKSAKIRRQIDQKPMVEKSCKFQYMPPYQRKERLSL